MSLMTGDRDEREIRELFQDLWRADEGRAPVFADQWEVALRRLRHPRRLWRPSRGAAAAALVVVVLGGFLISFRETMQRPSLEMSISRWRSPTEFLLISPADSLLKTIPRVGQPTAGIPLFSGEKTGRR